MTARIATIRSMRDDCFLFCPDDDCRILARRTGAGADFGERLFDGSGDETERQTLADVLPRPFAGDMRTFSQRTGHGPAPRFWFFVIHGNRSEKAYPVLIDRTLYAATGLCLAVVPHLETERIAAVLQTGACGSVGWSPAARALCREDAPFDTEAFTVLDAVFYDLTRGIFCHPNGAFSDAPITPDEFAGRLSVLAEFVGCGLAGNAVLPAARTYSDPRLRSYLENASVRTLGWRCRPEIASAFLLCALFAAREIAPGRSLRIGDFSGNGAEAVLRAGGTEPDVLSFCRRLADATGTHFGVSVTDDTLTLYMDFLTYDAQIPEGLKADPGLSDLSFVPTVVLHLVPVK